jgi:ABC-type Fe3+-hydroxamate transport system substrate-binding protein
LEERVDLKTPWACFDNPKSPFRVISLVPSLTEAIALLGGQALLTGRTRFCTHPPFALKGIQSVGGTKNPDLKAIQSLKPHLILASKEENRREDIERLLEAGLFIWVSRAETPLQAFAELKELKSLLELSDPKGLLKRAAFAYKRLSDAFLHQRPLRTLCFVWKSPFMVIGQDTYTASLLENAGLISPLKGRYPKITQEDVLSLDPELILLPDEPYPFGPNDAKELTLAFERAQKPAPLLRLIRGKNLFWPGLRAPLGLLEPMGQKAQSPFGTKHPTSYSCNIP